VGSRISLGFGMVLGEDGIESDMALRLGAPCGGSQDWGHTGLTFRVQEPCQPQMLLGCAEGSLQVVGGVGLGEFAEVHKIRPGQEHRAGRQQAGSRASSQASGQTALSGPYPGLGAQGAHPARGKLCVLVQDWAGQCVPMV
jgi:hypothetical protein